MNQPRAENLLNKAIIIIILMRRLRSNFKVLDYFYYDRVRHLLSVFTNCNEKDKKVDMIIVPFKSILITYLLTDTRFSITSCLFQRQLLASNKKSLHLSTLSIDNDQVPIR